MAVRLSVHEHAAIAAALAMEFGRELSSFPELVEAWEDDAAGHDVQAFNRHFDLSFSAEPLAGREVRSKACDVLPNTYGDTLFMTVGPNSLNLLRVEFMGGQAPRSEYASYADQILPWLREHVSKCEGMAALDPLWDELQRCTENTSLFHMLRLMIVGERLCFFGQVGARTSVRTMHEAWNVRESDRQLSIRIAENRAIAVDGFAPVRVIRDRKRHWAREPTGGTDATQS